MTTTVSIVGAGDLGGACAHALARGDIISRVVLVDAAGGVAAGKALDIQQSAPVDGFHTRLEGTADASRVAGSAVCVIADRAGQPPSEWQGDEGLAHLSRLLPFVGDAVVVFAGASQAGLLLSLTREAGYRRERVMASAPEALVAAIRSVVALEARCSPAEVMLTVLGAPSPAKGARGAGLAPSGFIVPWSDASIGGYALTGVLAPAQVARIEERAARLWPPGVSTLGMAAAKTVAAIVSSSRRAVSVLTVLGGEFGVRNRVGTLPALLGPTGIVHVHVPSLNTRERVLVETALGA